jgi:integrase
MANVYQTFDANGKAHPLWKYRYIDATGQRRSGTGWRDKTKTLNHARDLESECRAIRKGEKALPPSHLKHRNKPIGEIITDYMAWGRAQGGRYGRPWDEQNAVLKERALSWWVKELGLSILLDIDLVRVEKAAHGIIAGGLTPKTAALKVEALRSLCNWSVKRGLIGESPLRGIAKIHAKPKDPHRPLNDIEVAGLLNAAPAHRRLWYEVALETGFRLNELRCLRVKDVDVFGSTLFLLADFSKDRKDHRQAITRDLAKRLSALGRDREPGDRLLGIPFGPDPAEYIGEDYVNGGVTISTPEGRATWHSLRKAFVNNVVRSGADLKTVMEAARHVTPELTMHTYASASPDLLRAAAEGAAERIKDALAKAEAASHTTAKRIVAGAELETDNVEDRKELGENKNGGRYWTRNRKTFGARRERIESIYIPNWSFPL